MTVQEGEHLPLGGSDPLHPAPDEAVTLSKADHTFDFGRRGEIVLDESIQLASQVLHGGSIVHQEDLFHQVPWGPVQDGVEGTDQRGPGLK